MFLPCASKNDIIKFQGVKMKKEVFIVGAGFSGATCARILAENGYQVTVIDKNNHIGGNAYDEWQDGILIHKYGPHIFHTNDKEVFDFLSRFCEWFTYEHRVLAQLENAIVSVPFNLESLHKCFPKTEADEIESCLEKEYGHSKKIGILQLKQNPNPQIQDFANFVAKNIFVTYSEKQWGTPVENLDPNTLSRVPVYISYEDRYFTDKFQCQPKEGYTRLFENMLNHPNISIKLNVKAEDILSIKDNKTFIDGKPFDGEIIFTGPIDEFCEGKFGNLPYRSLKFEYEQFEKDSFQPAAVVNYTVSEKFTRISEFKKFTTPNPPQDKTIIIKEYSLQYEPQKGLTPYYPIINQDNIDIYEKYKQDLSACKNFHLLGRLGSYKYINMDMAVKLAVELCDKILNQKEKR